MNSFVYVYIDILYIKIKLFIKIMLNIYIVKIIKKIEKVLNMIFIGILIERFF